VKRKGKEKGERREREREREERKAKKRVISVLHSFSFFGREPGVLERDY